MSYINPMLGGNSALGGVQMALAAAYESRIHTMSKMTVARAQFAGDTAVTLTDGSYNTRFVGGLNPTNDIPKSATAQLANTSNSANTAGKPLVVKPLRDAFTAEIYDYAVFNADGTFPGGVNPLTWNAASNRYELVGNARYMVNKSTGEIYLNNRLGIMEHQNPDGLVEANGTAGQNLLDLGPGALQGINNVVGIVDFEALQGGALSAAQQQASELSGVVSTLTSVLRSLNENKKGTLSLIR